MCKKILKAVMYLLVFLLPLFWLPFSVEAFDFNKGYLMFLLVSIGVLAWLAQMIFKEKRVRFRWTPLDPFVLGFIVIMCLSSIFAVDRVSGLLGFYGRFWPSLVGFLSLGLFYFLVTNNVQLTTGSFTGKRGEEEKKKRSEITVSGLLKAFLASSFVVAVLGYFSLFGLLRKLGQVFGNKLPAVMSLRTFNTIGGSLEVLSLFVAFVSVLLVVLLAFQDKEGLLKSNPAKKKKNVGLYLLLLLNVGLLVIVDFTASWLVLFISLFLFLVFSFWKRLFKENVNRLSLSIFLALLGLIFLFSNPLRSLMPQGTAITSLPSEVLLNQRTSWGLAWHGLKDHPILGSGPANFGYVFSRFIPKGFLETAFWQLRFDRAGSYIAEFVGTTGVLGILSYLLLACMFLLVSYFYIASFKLKGVAASLTKASDEEKKEEEKPGLKQERKIMIIPFLITFVALLIGQFTYYQTATLAFTFWLVLSLGVVSWGRAPKEKVFSFRDFPEVGLVFSIVFWVLIMGVAFLYFNLGKYYIADACYRDYLINPTENVAKLEKAVRFAPKRTTYHIVLARDYLRRFAQEVVGGEPNPQVMANMVALAVQESKTATILSPNQVAAHEMAGVVYRDIRGAAQGAQQWATKSFERALELEPKNPVITTELGKLYVASNEKDKARELFQRAVELKPDYADSHLQLALLDDQEGKAEEAKGRLESLVLLSPFSVEAHFQLGRIYYNEGSYDAATEQFQAAITLFPNHSNSLYSLALIHERQGKKNEAIRLLERVLELNPGNQDVEKKIEDVKAGRTITPTAPAATPEEVPKGTEKPGKAAEE